jgi:prepilin-type N-terminal cleavage/methylation domain-containing protein
MRSSHRTRGVSILELSIVLAIITILAGITVASLNAVRSRTTFSAVATNIVNEMRRARMQSMNRGMYTAFVVNTNLTGTNARTWWVIQTDKNFLTNFISSGFSPAGCVAPCVILSTGTLPGAPDTTFGLTSGSFRSIVPTTTGLPAPLATIPDNPSSGSKWCSFCLASGQTNWGAILFAPGGEAKFSNGTGLGQQLVLTNTRDNVTRAKLIAVLAKNGMIETFDKP